jgi:hypothetical protein
MPPPRVCDVQVLRVLIDHGPLTRAEIQAKGGMSEWNARAGLRWLRNTKRVYIKGFKDTGERGREHAIYAIGNEPDAVFVRTPGAEYCARYRERHRLKIRLRDRRRRNGWDKKLRLPSSSTGAS